MEIKELLLELCRVPRTFETLLKEVFDHYGLVMTFQQHVLVGSTIRSYLSWLKDMGEMEAYIEENSILIILWTQIRNLMLFIIWI